MQIADLAALLPSVVVSTDDADLRMYARDWWPLAMLRERRGDVLDLPAAVARPRSTEEVATILRWANETRTPVVPVGGGSSVVGGAQAVPGAIALDLKGLDHILAIDPEALAVRTQTGIMGPALEEALGAQGLTLGHFPQSIEISTVGGWLSARGAGQKSARYGRIEEMLLGAEVVLPSGRIVRTPATAPATATGPDLARLFVGAEGTLGVMTEATLRLHPAPVRVTHGAYSFPDFASGLTAVRRVFRAGLRPAVLRLYDQTDVTISFRSAPEAPSGGALAVLRFEGEEESTARAEEAAARAAIEAEGGTDVGSGIAEWWWDHRNEAVGTMLKVMFEGMLGPNALVDTAEIAGFWPSIPDLYQRVRAAIGEHADIVGCHASHGYPQGACLYFTFLVLSASDDTVVEERNRACWKAAMEATIETGGTISHHHGVGLLKAPWAEREIGSGMDVLRAIKRALDPNGIMNPGKLGL
ncbi:MAG: FAD-binding oxidoreductase [Actinomycetota bacterium]